MPEKPKQPAPARVKTSLAAVMRFLLTAPGAAIVIGLFVATAFLGVAAFGDEVTCSFTAELFGALAWPAAVLLLAWSFYGPLCDLMGRAKSGEAAAVEAELRDSFADLEDQTAPLFDEAVAESRGFRLDAMLLELDVARSARQSILDAWFVVERSLRDLIWAKARTQPPRTFRGLEERINEEQLLPERVSMAIETLRRIYRAVRNVADAEVAREHAEYYQRSVSLVVSAVNAEIQRARESSQ